MNPAIPTSLEKELQLASEEGSVQLLSNGLINHTWICCSSRFSFPIVLQQINNQVFKNPQALVNNHQQIHQIWQQQQSLYPFKIAAPLPFSNNSLLFYDQKGYPWRIQEYIAETISITKPASANQLYEAARSFGEFARMTQLIPPHSIQTTIENFHNLRYRFEQFQTAKNKGNADRIKEAFQLIKNLENRFHYINRFDAITNSPVQFPTRIRHHDAKIANLLFDNSTNKVIAIVDLDTTMPGFFFSDLGDMIRSMAGKTDENHTQLDQIVIDEDYYDALVTGYQSTLAAYSTPEENKWIHWSGIWIIYMQCLRFITDYFLNDQYYRIEYPLHNLDRAWNQYQLLVALEQHLKRKFDFEPGCF